MNNGLRSPLPQRLTCPLDAQRTAHRGASKDRARSGRCRSRTSAGTWPAVWFPNPRRRHEPQMETSMLSCSMMRVMPRVRINVPPCCSPRRLRDRFRLRELWFPAVKTAGSIGSLPRGALESAISLLSSYVTVAGPFPASHISCKNKSGHWLPSLRMCRKSSTPEPPQLPTLFDQMTNESKHRRKPEGRDIGHHVICAARHKTSQSRAFRATRRCGRAAPHIPSASCR